MRGYHAIAAAPWDDFRSLFDEQWEKLTWKKATYLSLEQQRRRTQGNLPQEHYELAVHRHQLTDRDSGRSINCRVIFVFSTADQKVAAKNREKSVQKIRDGLTKIAQQRRRRTKKHRSDFDCPPSQQTLWQATSGRLLHLRDGSLEQKGT